MIVLYNQQPQFQILHIVNDDFYRENLTDLNYIYFQKPNLFLTYT